MQQKVISVLIGLIGACNNNAKTENTDNVVLEALTCPESCSESVIAKIRAEKHAISPGCAACATPCGNTSDYDFSRIYNAEPKIRDIKQRILAEICQLATIILQNGIAATDENTRVFYKALAYVSYDLSEQTLLALLEEIHQEITKTRKINND